MTQCSTNQSTESGQKSTNESVPVCLEGGHVQLGLSEDVDGGEVLVPGDGHAVQGDVREAVEGDVEQPAVHGVERVEPLDMKSLDWQETADIQGVQQGDI